MVNFHNCNSWCCNHKAGLIRMIINILYTCFLFGGKLEDPFTSFSSAAILLLFIKKLSFIQPTNNNAWQSTLKSLAHIITLGACQYPLAYLETRAK